MTTKDKYIQKLEELIKHQKELIDFFAQPEYTDVIILDLNHEISSLKAEMEKEEPQKSAEDFKNIKRLESELSALNQQIAEEREKGDSLFEIKDEWYRTIDKIPNEKEKVLCFNGYRIFEQSWCEWTNHDLKWFKKEFAYWMPLPKLPTIS